MKTKGFTLMELLAVIIIMAIIALIATPIIINIIENNNRKAAEASIANIEHAADIYYYNNGGLSEVTFNCHDGVCSNENTILDISGTIPESGQIRIDKEGNIFLNSLIIKNYFCYKDNGNYTCEKVSKLNDKTNNGILTLNESKIPTLSNYIIKGNSYQETSIKSSNLVQDVTSDKWILTGGAYIENGYIVFPNADAKAEITVEWNGQEVDSAGKYSVYWGVNYYGNTAGSTVHLGASYLDESKKMLSSNGYAKNNGLEGSDSLIYDKFSYNDTTSYGKGIRDAKYITFSMRYNSNYSTGSFKIKDVIISKTPISKYEEYSIDKPSLEYSSEIKSVGDLVTEEGPNKGKYEIPIKVTGENSFEASIYLDEPLRCVNGVCDELNFSTGIVTRKIGTLTFNGNETFNILENSNTGSGIGVYFSNEQLLGDYSSPKFVKNAISTHFKETNSLVDTENDSLIGKMFISPKSNPPYLGFKVPYTNKTDWENYLETEYLNSTPVTVNYELVESEYKHEKILLPVININKGESEIFVDTHIKPSEFIIDYYK